MRNDRPDRSSGLHTRDPRTGGRGRIASARAGTRSLATVLAADGNNFDKTWGDFDVLDRAVRTVLGRQAGQPGRGPRGRQRALTAFLPTDRAFRRLVRDLTGTARHGASGVRGRGDARGRHHRAGAALPRGPGQTLTYGKVLKADDVELGPPRRVVTSG